MIAHELRQDGIPHGRPAGPLRIVAIGGGTGLATLLQGLKPYSWLFPRESPETMLGRSLVDITAVVTVTDDGGSSGRLRREFKVLPPGDIRNCMVALSEDEALLSQLFRYRFPGGRGLKGHSFGNLFLTALTDINGDFAQAVKLSSEVLAIVGRIYPSTAANVGLEAVLADGTCVKGETRISRSRSKIDRILLTPRRCKPLPETLDALAQADLITLGPGSLFTSIIPNLLVEGVADAIRNSPAIKACFMNLMWQPGETVNFTAADHVDAIRAHARSNLLDYVVINTQPIGALLQQKYARRRARPVESDVERLKGMGLSVIGRNLLRESDMVRHDPAAIAAIALDLARIGRREREARTAAVSATL